MFQKREESSKAWISDQRGFSLVELIIVIAIMAILTGLFAGFYIKYIDKARISKQEDEARMVYDVTQAAMTEFIINENELGLSFDSVTPLFTDPVTGKTCGRITGWSIGKVQAGNNANTQVETVLCKYILENIGGNIDFAEENPINKQCNFTDDKVRIVIVFDDDGIFRLEYGYKKYLTTVSGGAVSTEKWSNAKKIKFTNPN